MDIGAERPVILMALKDDLGFTLRSLYYLLRSVPMRRVDWEGDAVSRDYNERKDEVLARDGGFNARYSTPVIFNSFCKKAWDELSVANRLSSMLGHHGTSEGWKMEIFIGEGKREKVCTLSVETVENCTSDFA
jgi:hypothetical protein